VGLSVRHEPFVDQRWQRLQISGDMPERNTRRIANDAVVNLDELATYPQYGRGLNGCLQLVFLVCLSHKLRWGMRRHDDEL
jgi:hypothetical protein